MVTDDTTVANVQEYYGQTLADNSDLQTNACCIGSDIPNAHKEILATLEDEIVTRFYGCGSPLPNALEGCTLLDLGCGTGRDAYLASKLVGPNGTVIGVDMTDQQLEVAKKYRTSQSQRFGYDRPNISFHKGFIEDLCAIGIEDNSVDVVISNCVINLSSNKQRVFEEIYRVLKPGGELYFSDVYADRRIPDALKNDPIFHGECLGGALYIEDFRRMLVQVGFPDYRIAASSKISIDNKTMEAKAGPINFDSLTIRTFKLDRLEDRCEDFGQSAIYLGTFPDHPHSWALDDHHLFETGRSMNVCGNTAAMLSSTRFAKHFQVSGDQNHHFGLFDCGPEPVAMEKETETSSTGGCC